jgi:hypothetical protein
LKAFRASVWAGLRTAAVVALLALANGCASTPKPAPKPSPGTPLPAATPDWGTHGPTLCLDSARGSPAGIAISDFMYFVPLISPDPVTVTESPGNTQRARIVRVTRRFQAGSFTTAAEFEITGEGFQETTFDLTNQIRRNEQRLQAGAVLERRLGSITTSGAGRGCIEVTGVLSNQLPVVTEVRLRFNEAGATPISIGLLDLRYADGAYRFDNPTVARVNTLTFRRAPGRPKMEVTLASVRRKDAGDGLWQKFVGGMTATAANLLLKPVTVDRTGHEAMLNFGLALATEQPRFTFPCAKNLKPGQPPASREVNTP